MSLEKRDKFGEIYYIVFDYLDNAKYPEPFNYIFEGVGEKKRSVKKSGIKGGLKYLVGKGRLDAYEGENKIRHDKINSRKIESGAILFAVKEKYKF